MPDRRKAKSKYTLDRAIPGAFEGETITRRRLMVLGANGAGAVATAAFTLPVLAFSLAPVFKTQNMPWQPIGPPSDFSSSDYTVKVVSLVAGIGEAGKSIAYVRSRNPSVDTEIDLVPHTAKQREVKAVLSNSFGFGGTNASLIFSAVQ